MGDNVITRGL